MVDFKLPVHMTQEEQAEFNRLYPEGKVPETGVLLSYLDIQRLLLYRRSVGGSNGKLRQAEFQELGADHVSPDPSSLPGYIYSHLEAQVDATLAWRRQQIEIRIAKQRPE